jgi:hypothetical protein
MMPPAATEEDLPDQILVSESLLVKAVDRLRSLVLQHPNPGLVKRVVNPILIPLWGLACFAQEQQHNSLHEDVIEVLQTYFAISVGEQPLKKLVDNLLWEGGSTWVYGVVQNHRIALVKSETASSDNLNVVRLLDTLQSRAKLFAGLLGTDPSSEERTGDIFLYVSENWLVQRPANGRSFDKLRLNPENENETLKRKLVSAKLAETLLDNFKDILSRRPLRVLELVKHIIDGELNRANARKKRSPDQNPQKVSLASLANIVPTEHTEHTEHENATESDSAESLPAVFSLLSTVLASPEFSATQDTLPILEVIKSRLDQLIPYLPQSLAKSGSTSSMLLEIHIASPAEEGQQRSSSEVSDFETHRRALNNLNSDLPPVQAEGFSLLSDLVKKASPVLDIPSTLTLLLSIITDPSEAAVNDEFIYLNAIKLIGTLASRHPHTVVKTLVDRYTDRNETTTLDQRLKIGESLLRTVQDLGETLTGEIGKILGEGMIAVAGRRAHKPEAQKRRKQQLEKEKRQKEREERQNKDPVLPPGWNISSPTPESKIHELEDDSDTESPEQAAHSANVIAAWAAGTSSDDEPDDLRARASALSILATAVQTNIAGLGSSVASSAVDLALKILALEEEPESAILRRASVVLLLDILKALDTARESRGSQALGFGFSLTDESVGGASWRNENSGSRGPSTIGNIPYMSHTLQFVESRETDPIVRGHIRVLIESLEAWIEKSLLWGIGAHERDGNEPRLELGDRIAGLDIDPLSGMNESGRPRIEEIE